LFERFPRHPIVAIASAMKLLDTSKPTAKAPHAHASHFRSNTHSDASGVQGAVFDAQLNVVTRQI
jgi:hypothetical protein